MNKPFLPDTNTVLRYLLEDEPELSKKAAVFWEKVRTGTTACLILESVIMESVYVLQRFYKVPRDIIRERLTGLLTYKGIINHKQIHIYTTSLKRYGECSLDFADCLLIEYQLSGIGIVFSFDAKINKLLPQNPAS